ncbi:M1 family metallopeptidase [Candidatus Saccharibacteria bacterium]|nr:M1 family metallopeptidase [Candidatus Saccharibacteria bacterium]
MERLLDYFVPEKYSLDLVIDKYKKTISGAVEVRGAAKAENVKFHAVGLSVDEVLIGEEKVDFDVTDGVLTLFKVPRGEVAIKIGYHGSLNENMQGAYISTYEYGGKTEVIVATQFESHYAREAFPCIDEPAAKAVFELAITTPYKDDVVLSNMPEVKVASGPGFSRPSSRGSTPMSRQQPPKYPESTFASGINTTIFEPTPRMSTYLLAWVIGKFHGKTIKNAHGVEITTYAALNQDIDAVDFANEIAAKSLEFYDDNFGVPYPLSKLDQVALPDFEAGAMENWGLVTYRESMLLAGKSATLGTKKGVALTVAHELSHQWFGDLVTMEWWDDLWLNESFASVMEYYAVDAAHPEYKIFEGFFTGDSYLALIRDSHKDVQSVHQEVHNPAEIATLFDPAIVYSKGARLMLMVIRAMGWEDFCKGLKDYFEKYKYQNTVGDDLWAALLPYAEFDVGKMMHAFIDKPGYPVITNKKGDFDEYDQKRFLLDGPMKKSDWPLPKITEDMSGHYVLNLSEAEFGERLNKFDELGLEEKIRLLIDRNLIAQTDLASAASLIPLIEKFKNEDAAAVWNIILSIVGNLKFFFDTDSEEEQEFKKFIGELVRPKLAQIGLVTKKNDDENTIRLRAVLLTLDYYAENKKHIEELADLYCENYDEMDPEIREDILEAKIYLEPEIVDKYVEDYQKQADPEIKFELLFAGTISKNPEVLKKMLGLLGEIEVVKPQDQTHLFIYMYRNRHSRDGAFLWLRQHWEDVKKMAGDKSMDDYPRYTANMIRTESEYEAWKDFFMPMKDDPALKRAIEIGKNEIEARLKLIADDKAAVYAALKKIL